MLQTGLFANYEINSRKTKYFRDISDLFANAQTYSRFIQLIRERPTLFATPNPQDSPETIPHKK